MAVALKLRMLQEGVESILLIRSHLERRRQCHRINRLSKVQACRSLLTYPHLLYLPYLTFPYLPLGMYSYGDTVWFSAAVTVWAVLAYPQLER